MIMGQDKYMKNKKSLIISYLMNFSG